MRAKGGWLLLLCLAAGGCGGPAQTRIDLESKAISYNASGYEDFRQSKWNQAEGNFARALRYNRLIDRREGIAANLNNLGVVAREQGDLDQAVIYFREALAINRESGDAGASSETLNNLGVVYQARGNLKEADHALQEALVYAYRVPPGPLLALTLTHLGDVALARKDYIVALNYYHQGLRADEGSKDLRGRATRWERLGRTFLELKDYGRAEMYLQEALGEFRRLQDSDGIAESLRDLTLLALDRGDRQEALLRGELLFDLYQARSQEQRAKEWEAWLKERLGKAKR